MSAGGERALMAAGPSLLLEGALLKIEMRMAQLAEERGDGGIPKAWFAWYSAEKKLKPLIHHVREAERLEP